MKVFLRVSGHVVEYFPGASGRIEVETDRPTPLSDILAGLGVAEGLVMAALAGGMRRPLSYEPLDGEEVTLIGPPAGG